MSYLLVRNIYIALIGPHDGIKKMKIYFAVLIKNRIFNAL
jgi:hypothetical protein